jgi:glycine cleavage system H lipoate-binding protein
MLVVSLSIAPCQMTNPIIQTDIAEILGQINQKLDTIGDRLTKVEVGQARIEGKIEAVDEKLSGKIEAVDEKLSGKIEAVDEKLSGKIEAVDEKLSGKIEAVDEKLSGKIEIVDEKLSGQVKSLDTKVEQLDKRISNSELTNRGILIGLIVIILGGASCSVSSTGETPATLLRAAKLFGLMPNS